MTAVFIAGVVGGPISGALLALDGLGGLAGWQWLFLLEGLPAIVLGFVVWAVLIERPEDATFLTDAERRALTASLAEEQRDQAGHARTVRDALKSGRIWLLAVLYLRFRLASTRSASGCPRSSGRPRTAAISRSGR